MAFLAVGDGKEYSGLQAAIDASSAGDTIHLYPGTYTGPFTISHFLNIRGIQATNGFASDLIVITASQNSPLGAVTIEGTGGVAHSAPMVIEGVTISQGSSYRGAVSFDGIVQDRTVIINRCELKMASGASNTYAARDLDDCDAIAKFQNCYFEKGYAHTNHADANTEIYATSHNGTWETYNGTPGHADVAPDGTSGYGPSSGAYILAGPQKTVVQKSLSDRLSLGVAIAHTATAGLLERDIHRQCAAIADAIVAGLCQATVDRISLQTTVHGVLASRIMRGGILVIVGGNMPHECHHVGADALTILRHLYHSVGEPIRRGAVAAIHQAVAARMPIVFQVDTTAVESLATLRLLHHSMGEPIRRGAAAAIHQAVAARMPIVFQVDKAAVESLAALQTLYQRLLGNISAGPFRLQTLEMGAVLQKDVWTQIQSITESPLSRPVFPSENIPNIDAEIPAQFCVGGKYAVFLDGMPIAHRITSMTLVEDEDTVHKELTMESSDMGLWEKANPQYEPGQPRVELHVGSRVLQFIIDDRELAGENEFTIIGLSLGARNEKHYLQETWSAPAIADFPMARDYAEQIAPVGAVRWDLPINWKVPTDFAAADNPLDTLQAIASVAGAILQTADDGRIVVRRRWPTRPIHMRGKSPDVAYDRTVVVETGVPKREPGTGHDCIVVSGMDTTSAGDTPSAEVEEDDPKIGDPIHIRLFWERRVPKTAVEQAVTAGFMHKAGEGEAEFPGPEEDPAIVDFTEGTGSLSHPISRLKSLEWIGRSAGPVEFDPYTKELRSAGQWGVARVRWYSKYSRFYVAGHNVERLIAAWGYGQDTAMSKVMVCLNSSDASDPADPIEDAGITGDNIAIERGTAELDNTVYDVTTLTWEAPYEDAAGPGSTAHVRNEKLFVSGNFKIRKVETRFEGPAIWQSIEGELCHCPEL